MKRITITMFINKSFLSLGLVTLSLICGCSSDYHDKGRVECKLYSISYSSPELQEKAGYIDLCNEGRTLNFHFALVNRTTKTVFIPIKKVRGYDADNNAYNPAIYEVNDSIEENLYGRNFVSRYTHYKAMENTERSREQFDTSLNSSFCSDIKVLINKKDVDCYCSVHGNKGWGFCINPNDSVKLFVKITEADFIDAGIGENVQKLQEILSKIQFKYSMCNDDSIYSTHQMQEIVFTKNESIKCVFYDLGTTVDLDTLSWTIIKNKKNEKENNY